VEIDYDISIWSILSISRYVSLSALDKEIIFFDDIKEMNHQLSEIGNNLNQLTVLAHQGKIKEVNLTRTRETFTGLDMVVNGWMI